MNAHKRYLAKLNLLAKIHKAIAPILETKRKADELLDRCIRSSHEKQRYCCLVGDKYNGHVYKLGTLESDLSENNAPFCQFSVGVTKADSDSRTVSISQFNR